MPGDIALRLARVKPHVLAVLRADGIIDRIGVDHLHGNVHRAVHAALGDESPPPTPRRGPEQR